MGVANPHVLGVRPHHIRAYGSTGSTAQRSAANLPGVYPPHLESNENTLLQESGDVSRRKRGGPLMRRAVVVFSGLLALGVALTAVRSSSWGAPSYDAIEKSSCGGGFRVTHGAMFEVSSGRMFHRGLLTVRCDNSMEICARARVSLLLWFCVYVPHRLAFIGVRLRYISQAIVCCHMPTKDHAAVVCKLSTV